MRTQPITRKEKNEKNEKNDDRKEVDFQAISSANSKRIKLEDIEPNPGDRGDDAARIRRALDALPQRRGVVVISPSDRDYVVKTPVVLRSEQSIEVPVGVHLLKPENLNSDPVFIVAGNFASIIGGGFIVNRSASPWGTVVFGPAKEVEYIKDAEVLKNRQRLRSSKFNSLKFPRFSHATLRCSSNDMLMTQLRATDQEHAVTADPVDANCDTVDITYTLAGKVNVLWSRIEAVNISGAGGKNDVGIQLQGFPPGYGAGTYANDISNLTISNFGVGLKMTGAANANSVTNVDGYKIGQRMFEINGCSQWSILGGFVHHSSNATILSLNRSTRGVATDLRGEPGGNNSKAYLIDRHSRLNRITMQANTAGESKDHGIDNMITLY